MAEITNDGTPPRFTGFIDDFVSGRLHGWAIDHDKLDYGACLAVFVGGRLAGTCRADVLRPDLVPLMPGEGRHGFECILDEFISEIDHLEVLVVDSAAYRFLTEPGGVTGGNEGPTTSAAFRNLFSGLYGEITDFNDDSRGLRSFRTNRNTALAQGDVDVSRTILFEVGDLVAFHRAHIRVTGIQRVLCGLIDALLMMDGTDDVEFCLLGQRPGVIDVVDKGLLGRLVFTLLSENATRGGLDELLGGLERGACARRTRATDILFIAGAFWIHDRLDRSLARMREQGTALGLLVHDLIPLTHPHLVSASTARAFVAPAIKALPLFDFLITTSAFVAGQARSLLANEVGRVPMTWTVPLPHRSIASASSEGQGASTLRQESFGSVAGDPFVLCVCTIEARKNHMLLYRVWAGLLRKYGGEAVPRLVFVGRWGWEVEELRRALDGSDNLDGHIVVMYDVGDQALADLYKRCLFTVFPSFAEGWGLPVGESLAAGKICIASRATAIPEVGGDFCAYFDPHDVLDAFAAIERPIVDRHWLSDCERRIEAEFRPRGWIDTSSDLLRTLHAARDTFRSDAARKERAGAAIFSAGDVLDLTSPRRHEDGAPWLSRRAESVLSYGWHAPGPDGVRPRTRDAVIMLTTDFDQGACIVVLLRLAGTGRKRPCCLRLEAGRDFAVVTITGKRQCWFEVEAVAGCDGVVRLTVTGLSEGLVVPDDNDAGFALRSIAVCGEEALDGKTALYRKLLLLPQIKASTPRPEM